MLKHRIITALVLLVITVAVIFYAPPLAFAACCWLLCLTAIYELTKMYKFSLIQSILTLLLSSAAVVGIAITNSDLSQIMRIVIITTWCFVAPLILIFTPRKFPKISIFIFSLILFIPAYYALNIIHAFFGAWQLVSLLAIAWVADTGAYFVGRSIGKRKLAPQISPGKSIEGALGGFVFVLIYLVILKSQNVVDYLPNYGTAFKFAFILTAVSIVGDLFESWFKRVAQVKDSGSLLPGHGGVFDRVDSLIAVIAIAYAMISGMKITVYLH